SSNLGDDAGLAHLLDSLHAALGDTESFERERIKSRAIRCETFHVSTQRRGFVHATVLFSPRRPGALRGPLVRQLLDIMRGDPVMGGADVATSVEIREFEPGMYITERDI